MTIKQMRKHFDRLFGPGGEIHGYFAPGRVNLIGEHIDYNGGHVFPCALTVGNYVMIRKRNDRELHFYSLNFKIGGMMISSLDNMAYSKRDGWTNYPRGVIDTFQKHGMPIDTGLDILVYGNIPGSGLSSSAAMEVSIAVALKDMFGYNQLVDREKTAILAQEAECNYNGLSCGIMDQYASAMGKQGHAILLNCANLEHEYIPLNIGDCKILVINSNKPHSLVSSHYNERRAECERALADLKKVVNIENLCDLKPAEFEKYKDSIQEEVCRRRAKHAVYEEQRVLDCVQALKDGDFETFGRLLNESGDSLRYDYEATCFEIDTLVEAARHQEGVLGARETGGGWGGNIVALVKGENVDEIIQNIQEEYKQKTNLKADVLILSTGHGGRKMF